MTYLISTTSFKSYSKELIKRMTKMVEDIDLGLGDSPASEIFCLQTMVRKDKMSYVGDKSPLIDSKRLNSPQNESNGYKQIISRVSHGFCRLLKLEKHVLIGSDLNMIIPDGYKEAHEIRLSYILDLESEINKKIAPSKFFHMESFLPIKGASENLHNGNICVRFHIDIQHGLSFIATIKNVPSQNISALLNFDGTLREKERGFPREAL